MVRVTRITWKEKKQHLMPQAKFRPTNNHFFFMLHLWLKSKEKVFFSVLVLHLLYDVWQVDLLGNYPTYIRPYFVLQTSLSLMMTRVWRLNFESVILVKMRDGNRSFMLVPSIFACAHNSDEQYGIQISTPVYLIFLCPPDSRAIKKSQHLTEGIYIYIFQRKKSS